METSDNLDGTTATSSSSNIVPEFNLRWDEFRRVVVDSLWTLLTEESLVDCTLACSPTEQVKVHRVVLSANSPYFRSILSSYSSHPHPIIILQDVRFSVLKLLVTFMYRGEVSVSPEEMNSLLKTADNLQIIGLSQQTCHRLVAPTSNTSSVMTATTSETMETSTVYSKKQRILDATSAVSKSDVISEPPNPAPIKSPASYDEQEQDSPLALKKEDDDWDSRSDHQQQQQKSSNENEDVQNEPLCLRYCCIYCSTNFPSQSALSRHIMLLHPTVYSALYSNPSASTTSSSAMDQPVESPPEPPPHYRSSGRPSSEEMNHSPPGPGDLEEHVSQQGGIVCKFCGKPFPEVSMLIQHLPIHTGERPFKCEFCGKAFKLRHHMKDHARVHTGERPFRCGLCGKTFSRSTILKAHEKTHFPKNSSGGV
ncbi:unnamed protein product [Allacma fusca]|uniref:Uncharacterized protein n=1 Tax=Allacma fusca TaxID=39272 RepID=A0A8J2PD97_9HEXA|nr:unnamed protein product [Allacma fusca]